MLGNLVRLTARAGIQRLTVLDDPKRVVLGLHPGMFRKVKL